jgi:DNA-directed RNA polymerase specialized sigma24 family protein
LQRNRETPVDSFPLEMVETDDHSFTEEHYAAFATAWNGLCDKCQAVLKGFYYDDLPHAKIADLQGKNIPAVKQDKHRCVEKLRKLFFAQIEKI